MSDQVAIEKPTMEEKVLPMVEESPTQLKDSKHRIDDEAGALVNRALASGNLDPEESRKVLRKIDFYILPFLFITYGL